VGVMVVIRCIQFSCPPRKALTAVAAIGS
jgi:hypothetical protein